MFKNNYIKILIEYIFLFKYANVTNIVKINENKKINFSFNPYFKPMIVKIIINNPNNIPNITLLMNPDIATSLLLLVVLKNIKYNK